MSGLVEKYGFSLAAVLVAGAVRWLLDAILQNELPFFTFYFAVLFAAWFGGLKPGLLALGLSAIAGMFFFTDPRFSLGISRTIQQFDLARFVGVGVGISLLAEVMHHRRRQADQQRETLRTTLASIGDGVITTDLEGRITSLNAVAEAVTGWTQSEARGQPLETVFRIVNERTRQPAENPAVRAIREGIVVGLANQTVLIRKDGTQCPIDDSASPIRDERGRVSGCVLIFRDVTERWQREQEMASQLAGVRLLASIVQSSDDAIVSKSLDGIIQSWNASAERLFGYSAAEAVGQPILLIIPADRADEEARIIARIRAGEEIEHFDTVRQHKDGHRIAVSLTVSPVRNEAGEVIGASKIARDITDRKRDEVRINNLNIELKEADRRKDEFLATLAHELRGPLAPLRHMLEILKRTDGNSELLAQARDTMERQLSQLVRLVDDLLDMSRITRNKLELRQERVTLAAILERALESSRPFAESLQHELIVLIPPEPIHLNADPVRLTQVFSNLLQNACKYTEPNGRIWLTAERTGTEVVVAVKDTGIGIPSDKLASVFEMFTQIDQSLERSQGGLGIGLTLVKRLVELHGGTVEARSAGPGGGSEFIVRLPVLHSEPAPPTPEPRDDQAPAAARRILVVDDNEDSAESLSVLLSITGNETFTAHDGLEALKAAESFRPDVVLMDIGLPRMNGYEVCRRMREQPWGRKLVLVALTGWGQEEDRRRSKEAGFDHHIVKPVDPAALMQLLAARGANSG